MQPEQDTPYLRGFNESHRTSFFMISLKTMVA